MNTVVDVVHVMHFVGNIRFCSIRKLDFYHKHKLLIKNKLYNLGLDRCNNKKYVFFCRLHTRKIVSRKRQIYRNKAGNLCNKLICVYVSRWALIH